MSRPTVRDLGELAGPVLVFGGPYGNLEATLALIDAAGRHGIPAGRAVCTGDVVAYAADPEATVAALRDWGAHVVMGNCEESLAVDAADCGCGFADGTACAALSEQWFAAAQRDVSAQSKRWMAGLPGWIAFTLAGLRFVALHGAASRINRYVFASTSEHAKAEEIAAACARVGDVDGVLGGHCGVPFAAVVGGCLWHNAGAIGMPANDGTARTWYSILTPTALGVKATFHALDYDHQRAAAKMRARGYPAAYAAALCSGMWPSCDVLPPAERAARGVPLSPAALTFRGRNGTHPAGITLTAVPTSA